MNNVQEFLSKALEGATIKENGSLVLSDSGGVLPTPQSSQPPQPEEIRLLLEDYFQSSPDSQLL